MDGGSDGYRGGCRQDRHALFGGLDQGRGGRQLKKHAAANIVLDPVMVAQSGDKLLQDTAITAIKAHLLPLATS